MLSLLSILFTLATAYQSKKESYGDISSKDIPEAPKMYEAVLPSENYSPEADLEPTPTPTITPDVMPAATELANDFGSDFESPFFAPGTSEPFATATAGTLSSGERLLPGVAALVAVLFSL